MDQQTWLSAAEAQLQPLVPQQLWARLYEKLHAGVFDAGTVLSFAVLDEHMLEAADGLHPEAEGPAMGEPSSRSESAAASSSLALVAVRDLEPAADVFLCDHAWSFYDSEMAQAQLAEHPQLRARLGAMLLGRCGEFLGEGDEGFRKGFRKQCDDADWLMRGVWSITGSYSVARSGSSAMVVHYVLDEIGSSFAPAPSVHTPDPAAAAFLMVPFVNPTDGVAYSVFFPRRRVTKWDRATCAGLPHARSRAAALASVLVPNPRVFAGSELVALHDSFHRAGFQNETVCQLLGVGCAKSHASQDVDEHDFAYTYLPAWDLGPGSAASSSGRARLDKLEAQQVYPLTLLDLVRLFILGQPINSLDRVVDAVGGMKAFRALTTLGILWQPAGAHCVDFCQADGSAWASAVQLVPVPLGTTTGSKVRSYFLVFVPTIREMRDF
eukprot:SAG31_NODE_7758_length_1602_cov_1.607452_1_plen_437_part_01